MQRLGLRLGHCARLSLFRSPQRAAPASLVQASAMPSTASDIPERASAILRYWMGDLDAPQGHLPKEKVGMWWGGGPDLDNDIRSKFSQDLDAADKLLASWNHAYPGLATVILMDQFARNMYRGTGRMYAWDGQARQLAQQLWEADKEVKQMPIAHRMWLLYPFMHSESEEDQQVCVSGFKQLKVEAEGLDPPATDLIKMLGQAVSYANKHLEVVQQWGRFPHRNKLLGRPSTEAELKGFETGSIPSF